MGKRRDAIQRAVEQFGPGLPALAAVLAAARAMTAAVASVAKCGVLRQDRVRAYNNRPEVRERCRERYVRLRDAGMVVRNGKVVVGGDREGRPSKRAGGAKAEQ